MRHAPWYSLVFAAVLGTGTAWGAEDIGAAVNACRAEADDARRLACYDRAAGRAAVASALRDARGCGSHGCGSRGGEIRGRFRPRAPVGL